MKAILISMIFFISSILCSQEADLLLPENPNYENELLNFYFENGEYELVISITDTLEYSDDLMLLKGKSYHLSGNPQKAVDILSDIILVSTNEIIRLDASKEIKKIAKEFSPLQSIEILSELLLKFEFSEYYPQILLLIAKVYEDFQLYEEANDVYYMLINQEQNELYKYKIGVNFILLKEFRQALNLLLPISEIESEEQNEILYLIYIAYFSMNDLPNAKDTLLRLYHDFPECEKRVEVVSSLADIFKGENKYLISWFLLNEAMKQSSEIQQYHLNNRIDEIRVLISTDSLSGDPFEHLELKFEKENEEGIE